MSKHHNKNCNHEGYESYGIVGNTGSGLGFGGTGFSSWIYSLILLIVIVLQFGKNDTRQSCNGKSPDSSCNNGQFNNNVCNNTSTIDNSILFIITVFLLIISGGCPGGYKGYGTGYGGYGWFKGSNY